MTLLAGELLLPAVSRSDAGKSATDHRSEVIIHHRPVVRRERGLRSAIVSIGQHMADLRRAGCLVGWLYRALLHCQIMMDYCQSRAVWPAEHRSQFSKLCAKKRPTDRHRRQEASCQAKHDQLKTLLTFSFFCLNPEEKDKNVAKFMQIIVVQTKYKWC